MIEGTWTVLPHVCRRCGGCVFGRKEGFYACSTCGTEARGTSPGVVCWCGRAPFRCGPNPAPPALGRLEVVVFAGDRVAEMARAVE
jgi:hypothetical protein